MTSHVHVGKVIRFSFKLSNKRGEFAIRICARGPEEQLPKQSGVITVTDSHASSLHDMCTHTVFTVKSVKTWHNLNSYQWLFPTHFLPSLQVCEWLHLGRKTPVLVGASGASFQASENLARYSFKKSYGKMIACWFAVIYWRVKLQKSS